MPNIIMADKPTGEWTTEQVASKQGPSGNITLEGTSYPDYAIYRMPNITQVHFTNATSILERGAANCNSLQRIIAQKVATIGVVGVGYNPNLLAIDILGGGTINNTLAFAQNPKLETLIIRSATAKDVANNTFNGSFYSSKPINVYVPEDTMTAHAALTNWGSWIANGAVVLNKMEGSLYEPLDWWED